MLSFSPKLTIRSVFFVALVSLFVPCVQAQSDASLGSSFSSSSESSSSLVTEASTAALPAAPLPEGAAGYAGAGGQDRGGGGRYQYRSRWNSFIFEAGGGFNAPSRGSSPYITWGGNFNVGAGLKLDPHLAMLVEYQFLDNKLPGALIAETGADGGHAHIWSFTLNPEVDLFPKQKNDIYLTGGGGFYRKVTSFTDVTLAEYCDYFYCAVGTTNAVVGHFSSNQGGWSIGAGYQHRFRGMYGDSRLKLFAEARYLDVLTPATQVSPNGLGVTAVAADTKLVPVTLGIRF